MAYTRIHRLFKIITLIQSQTGWDARRLAQECGVKERTIYRDLEELEGVGVPYYFDQDSGGYRIRKDFFLPPVQLTPDEALSLAIICGEIAGKEQIAFLKPAWRALAKIEANFPAGLQNEINELGRQIAVRTAASTPAEDHADVYDIIQRALSENKSLECRYDSGSTRKDSQDFVLRPWLLFFCVRAWYVVGHDGVHDEPRTFKLARFTKLRLLDAPSDAPADFTIERYLGNAWRMIRGEPEHEVEILFDASFAQTVGDTLWHKTQSFEEHDDGSATFRCTVAGLDEITWWVLSMGPHCRVVAPLELAERVRNLAVRTAAVYAGELASPPPEEAID
ncbi:MAG: YafY family transcriptional regulator [Phycisphaerales bacterium]|nr:YafY family transcriptional regulator [Phycisphaerales bacterium]